MIWKGAQIQEALGIEVDSGLRTGILQFNSKDVKPGDLFIALKGATDGNFYAKDAIDRGASCVILDKMVTADIPKEKIILVSDTAKALRQLAEYKRKNSKAKFIGVTGSVGKTSTKEALKIMFEAFDKTFASRGNFNNDIGVPINLASMPDDLNYAIFELGMNSAGEIRKLSQMVKPDIAIITNVSPAHLEFFDSVESIVDAKCEIFEGLNTQGLAIINSDSIFYDQMIQSLDITGIKNIYNFSKSKASNSKLEQYNAKTDTTYVNYNVDGIKVEIEAPYILPIHLAENFASCLQVAVLCTLDLAKAAKALGGFKIAEGRGKIINITKDKKQFQIIGDYYNANPTSLKASLAYLKQINHLSKVVVIGDMLELGGTSPAFHQELVPYIIDSGATKVLLVGTKVKFINDLLPIKMYIRHFDNVDLLIAEAENIFEDNELILIKGSRGIKLQKIMDYFNKG